MKNILMVALPLALAGCGGGDTTQRNVTQVATSKPNPYQKQLLALNPTDRKLVLRRAIQDDGGSCPRINSSRYQQDYQGMAMWVAYCSNEAWGVYVDPDANVQARLCRQSKQLGLPECAPAPPDPDAPLWSGSASPSPPAGTR